VNERDLLFLVLILITASTLTIFIVQFVRSRRRRGEGGADEGRAGWWEGPWDDDKR
jgi:hypothetical protein